MSDEASIEDEDDSAEIARREAHSGVREEDVTRQAKAQSELLMVLP